MEISNLPKIAKLAKLRASYIRQYNYLEGFEFKEILFKGEEIRTPERVMTPFGMMHNDKIDYDSVAMGEDEAGTIKKFFLKYLQDKITFINMDLFDLGFTFEDEYTTYLQDKIGDDRHKQIEMNLQQKSDKIIIADSVHFSNTLSDIWESKYGKGPDDAGDKPTPTSSGT